MKTETDIAFALLRSAFAEQASHPIEIDIPVQGWWKLFRLMQKNRLAAATADTAAAIGLPREVLIPWLSEKGQAVDWHRHQRDVQDEIVGLMQQHGIETVVLKGTHVAQYWPEPETREFGDVDLFFYDRHREADRVAKEALGVEITNEAHHHTRYNYKGVTVESHYDLLNIHYPPSNHSYDLFLRAMRPDPTFEVLFMLRHAACHFAASRITLRDFVDWFLICRELKGKADWQLVQTAVKRYGMDPYVQALAAIADQRFGDASACRLAIPPYSRSVETDGIQKVEHDIVYGTVADHAANGVSRLRWKLRRWKALTWKRKMVFKESPIVLALASLTSHAERPKSILHKM